MNEPITPDTAGTLSRPPAGPFAAADSALAMDLSTRLERVEARLRRPPRSPTGSARGLPPSDARGRQARAPPARPPRRRTGRRDAVRRARCGRRRRTHPLGDALPRRRHGRRPRASRSAQRPRGVGQLRRHPHRRPPLRPRLAAVGRPGSRRGPPAGDGTFERLVLGQLSEFTGPLLGSNTIAPLHSRAVGQDRLAHRGGR